jgi:hypothetical protein
MASAGHALALLVCLILGSEAGSSASLKQGTLLQAGPFPQPPLQHTHVATDRRRVLQQESAPQQESSAAPPVSPGDSALDESATPAINDTCLAISIESWLASAKVPDANTSLGVFLANYTRQQLVDDICACKEQPLLVRAEEGHVCFQVELHG